MTQPTLETANILWNEIRNLRSLVEHMKTRQWRLSLSYSDGEMPELLYDNLIMAASEAMLPILKKELEKVEKEFLSL